MAEHEIEIVSQDMELHLRLVCRAVPGSPCRKRPPEGDDRESWYADDPGLVDADCWATEWVSEAGWDDAIIAADSRGRTVVWGSVPVSIGYDEGVAVSLVENPPALVPEPSDSGRTS